MRVVVKRTCTLVVQPDSVVEITDEQFRALGDLVEAIEQVGEMQTDAPAVKLSKAKNGEKKASSC